MRVSALCFAGERTVDEHALRLQIDGVAVLRVTEPGRRGGFYFEKASRLPRKGPAGYGSQLTCISLKAPVQRDLHGDPVRIKTVFDDIGAGDQ